MTDAETIWTEVWDAIFNIVQGVTDIGEDVYQGSKLPPVPVEGEVLVMIPAGMNAPSVSDTHGDYHVYSIPVMVLTKGDDINLAMKSCISWVGKIKKELLAHRTLDGLVNDIRFGQSRANPPEVAGYERQLVSFVVEARIWVDDPDSEE